MNKKMMMVLGALMAFALNMMAQTEPVTIESPLVTEKDFVWYTNQKEAWKAETQRHPQDETAWLNYYHAARYMLWFDVNDTSARQAVREMQAAIPDKYTYYLCAYCAIQSGHGLERDGNKYAEEALRHLPARMQFFDYTTWVCYLAMKGQEERMAQMAKRFFDDGNFSEAVLRYNYNELSGMDDGGIIIANGDMAIIPKWLIQEGMGRHRDKTVVCAMFLAVTEYREWLSKKLGIDFPEWGSGSYDENLHRMLQAIIDRFGSKVYFSTTVQPELMEPWKQQLYNEGLTFKYSKKPYDNMAVKRRNVEERYMLEYLLVSFRPEWTSGQNFSANYAVLLADLLQYYERKHDAKHYDWLMRLLMSGVSNTSIDEERKQAIMQLLK